MAERIARRINSVARNQLVTISSTDCATFPRKIQASNILYQVHHYEPGLATHCGASASAGSAGSYPGTMGNWGEGQVYWSRELMAASAANNNYASLEYNIPAINWAKQNNVPLYLGEWGMQSEICVNGANDYVRDTGELFIEKGLHNSYYVWKHGATKWGILRQS